MTALDNAMAGMVKSADIQSIKERGTVMQRSFLSRFHLAALAVVTLLVSACGGSGTTTTSNAVAPVAFYAHTAVFRNSTTVWVWGNNDSGQIGNNTTTNSTVPVRASLFGSPISGVAVGASHTLALLGDGTIRSWGYNGNGELGNGLVNGLTPNSSVPVTVKIRSTGATLTGIVAVAAGGYHSIAVDNTGEVWSWGSNAYNQLGRPAIFGSYSAQSASPVLDKSASPTNSFTAVAAGSAHSLALKNDGTVWSWGYNKFGQLGNNSTLDSLVPVQATTVAANGTIIKIAAGGQHNMALDSSGRLWIWGFNGFGQLGDGTTTDSHVPKEVTSTTMHLTSAALIAAGLSHCLVYEPTTDTLYAWGYNGFGQFGNNSKTDITTPVIISSAFSAGLRPGSGLITELLAVGNQSFAKRTDGSWWSWGDNSFGQLGIGSTTATGMFTPTKVTGF